MKKVSLMVLAVALVFSLFATPLRAAGEFNDVKGNQWFAPYVYDLADRGILNGKGNGKFEPEGNVTRAEFAKILAYASKDELKQYEGDSPFADCGSHWSKTNINWAYANGIVKGKSETTFAPNAEITREEMATMIYRYADYKDLALPKKADKITFKDADKIGSWAKEAVAAMQQANIIGGYPDGTFLPKNQASRAEAAKMISVFLKEATAKGVTEETYQDFMDKDVKDFEADRVLNFDASLADNFAVVQDDVELVQDNAKINQVTAANEEKGVYVFSNIDHRMKNLKPGDKLMIAGDDYEECVSLVVDNIEFSGAKAIITSQGGEIEDFFD